LAVPTHLDPTGLVQSYGDVAAMRTDAIELTKRMCTLDASVDHWMQDPASLECCNTGWGPRQQRWYRSWLARRLLIVSCRGLHRAQPKLSRRLRHPLRHPACTTSAFSERQRRRDRYSLDGDCGCTTTTRLTTPSWATGPPLCRSRQSHWI